MVYNHQSVNNFIITYQQDNYLHNFIKSLNGKYVGRTSDLDNIIKLPSGECFCTIPYTYIDKKSEINKVYIDSRINKNILREFVYPCCGSSYHILKFF